MPCRGGHTQKNVSGPLLLDQPKLFVILLIEPARALGGHEPREEMGGIADDLEARFAPPQPRRVKIVLGAGHPQRLRAALPSNPILQLLVKRPHVIVNRRVW